MAGSLHVFWSDGGKYRVAGFDVKRFDEQFPARLDS